MELTLNIPDRLVFRLRPHEARLANILELGLDALEAAEGFTTESPPGIAEQPMDRPHAETALWTAASDALAPHWQEGVSAEPLSSEILRAYGRGELDEGDAEAVRQRLMAQPQALEELLAMPDEPQADAHQDLPVEISDEDVQQAWRQLQLRQASRGGEANTPGRTSTAAATAAATATTAPLAQPSIRRRPERATSPAWRWLALAAGLLLTTGGLAVTQHYVEHRISSPKLSSSLLLDVSRGPRPYTVDPRADHLLLLLQVEPEVLAKHRDLRLEIIDQPSRQVVYRETLKVDAGGGSTLHLRVPRYRLPVGSYELRMSELEEPNGVVEPSVSFAIRESSEGAL